VLPSRLRGLLRTCRRALWPGRRDLLSWRLYRVRPDAELRRITVDYTVEFARVLRASSPNATFAFLSGGGADPTGRSRIAFARYKGEAENAIVRGRFPRVYMFRPAYITPSSHAGAQFQLSPLRAIYPAFRALFPNQVIRADDLARTMWMSPCEALEKAGRWFSRTVTSPSRAQFK